MRQQPAPWNFCDPEVTIEPPYKATGITMEIEGDSDLLTRLTSFRAIAKDPEIKLLVADLDRGLFTDLKQAALHRAPLHFERRKRGREGEQEGGDHRRVVVCEGGATV